MNADDVRYLVWLGWCDPDATRAEMKEARDLLYDALHGADALAAVVRWACEFERTRDERHTANAG